MKYLNYLFILSAIFLNLSCASKSMAALKPEMMSDKASTQYQLAYDEYIQGNLVPALSFALAAVESSPKNADARNLLGLIYFRQNKSADAEKQFKEAVLLNPKLSEGYNNLGTLYFEEKRYDEALASLNNALANPLYLYPERIRNNLGLVYQAMGDIPKAVENYRASIGLKKDFYLPYLNFGKLLIEKKDEAQARALLEKAVQYCSECSEPRYHLGTLLMKEKKTAEALRLFKQGAQVDPEGYYGELCKKFVTE